MRCFVAVELSEQVRSELAAVQAEARNLGLQASFPKKENLHLTLVFLGEKSDAEVKNIVDELAKIGGEPFSLNCSGVGFLPSENFARVLYAAVAPSAELLMLQKKILLATGAGEERPFLAHVTLARIKSRPGKEIVSGIETQFSGKVFGETLVSEFFLKKSILSPDGAVYHDVAAFPLEASK